ncbi:hypothetical protein [Desulfomonile tiedjei]|uniref:Lipoprotein n=1 Tax=Desulfomonile tiedjei (strain ATCC 49306 / DSM 6799 / DCB-1) TaxID=706587 RepID=I4C9T3_DESTA|nr:hypothetical protein [Desulfomonile tiedjei]AFM26324.1 hypothetical protein Desti_3679 [Desulfomonile tiedjei DSM 6799]
MIIKSMITISSIFLMIIAVAIGCAVASQPMPIHQEFDNESKLGTGDADRSAALQKQITSSVKGTQEKSSQPSSTQDASTRTGDLNLRQFFGSLLPSKQDLDKAFDDEYNRSFQTRPSNWRNGEK